MASTLDNLTLPSKVAMERALGLSIMEDVPIMMDYWVPSLDGEIIIGIRENEEKLLVKNSEEYTSPIQKIYKVENVYIIMTENSLYLVDSKCQARKIS
jgi:hypothetical protein